MKLQLTTGQVRAVRTLVKSECANYLDGNCLPSYEECIQMKVDDGLCPYFKNTVLPLDKDLHLELTRTGYQLTCKKCGQEFMSDKPNTQYCDFCVDVVARDKARERQRKKREGK